MKKLAYAASALLVAGMAMASFSACGDGNDAEKADSTKKEVKGEQKGTAYEAKTNIRYVDRDTLLAHYDYAIEQNKVLEQMDLDLQAFQTQLARNLQNKQAAMQQKMNSNAYTEATYKSDMEELQRLDQSSQAQYQQRALAETQRAADITKAVRDKVDAYIVKYNDAHHYDAILYKDAGLYFNPALDITGEIVKGLNAEFKAESAKKADEAKK